MTEWNANEVKISSGIIKLTLKSYALVKNKIIASFILFGAPLTLVGILLEVFLGVNIFSRGVFFGLLWLSIAPYLITGALFYLTNFFDDIKSLFVNDEEWINLRKSKLEALQSKNSVFVGFFIAAILNLILLTTIFSNFHFIVKLWVVITFGMLSFLSGVGFYGVYLLVSLMDEICVSDLKFDPYHPDDLGGLKELGSFSIGAVTHFFSGALLFPLAFEVIRFFSVGRIVNLLIYLIVGFFILTGLIGFITPQLTISNKINSLKYSEILNSEKKLEKMISDALSNEKKEKNLSEILVLYVYYETIHKRLKQVKTYPFDLVILIELLGSILIPIIIAALEIYA